MKTTILWTALLGLSFASYALTLDEAVELARKNSPRLKAAQTRTAAAEKAVSASGLWKNPTLNFSTDGVGGDHDGFREAGFEVMLKQTFPMGGKRSLDRQVSRRATDVAVHSRAVSELQLLSEVRHAFIDVFSQQEIGVIRAEQEQLGRAFVDVAKSRYESGGGSELDVVQAELLMAEVLLSQTCCFGDLEAARIGLASLMGVPEPDLKELTGDYYELVDIEDQLLADSHPVLMRMNAQVEKLRAKAARARASDSADITLGAGMKYEAAEGVNTFTLSASIPLNFVRGGRAAEAAALLDMEALSAEYDEVRRESQQRLSQLIAQYRGAKMEADILAEQLVPKAQEAYEVIKAGYEAGRFSWVELIRAQQHLADVRVRNVEALRDAHFAQTEIKKFMKEEL